MMKPTDPKTPTTGIGASTQHSGHWWKGGGSVPTVIVYPHA